MTQAQGLPAGEWAAGYDDVLAARATRALARKVSLGVDIGPDVLMLNWGMPNPNHLPAEETLEAIRRRWSTTSRRGIRSSARSSPTVSRDRTNCPFTRTR
jgi:hypothetical protein